jgi:hypothetical protein
LLFVLFDVKEKIVSFSLFTKQTETLLVWEDREKKILFAIVTRLIQEAEHALAIELLDESLKNSPNDPQICSCLGRVHLTVIVFFFSRKRRKKKRRKTKEKILNFCFFVVFGF